MHPPGWFRLMRAGAFAAVCVVLSQLGHDVMAGRPAPLWAGWAALAGLGAVGYCLADRRRPAWWILLAVEATQVCLHVWFSCCTPAGSVSPAPRMDMQGGGMHAATAGGMAVPHGAGMSLGMLAAHALAGCLVAAWLYAGERALWRALGVIAEFLVDRTLRVLVRLVGTGLPAGPRPTRVAVGFGEDEVPPEIAVLRHVLIRRGPPRAESVSAFTFV
jgi:hypothetical protein